MVTNRNRDTPDIRALQLLPALVRIEDRDPEAVGRHELKDPTPATPATRNGW